MTGVVGKVNSLAGVWLAINPAHCRAAERFGDRGQYPHRDLLHTNNQKRGKDIAPLFSRSLWFQAVEQGNAQKDAQASKEWLGCLAFLIYSDYGGIQFPFDPTFELANGPVGFSSEKVFDQRSVPLGHAVE